MGNEQEFRKHLCEAVDKIEDFEVDKKCINEDIKRIYSNAERHGCQCLCPEKTYHVQEKQDIRGKEKRECSRKVHDNQERLQFMKRLEYEILLNGYHKI